MSENEEEANAQAREQIEKLKQENTRFRDEVLELRDELFSFTGLPGHLRRLEKKIKQLKALLARAANALEKAPPEADSELVKQLRKAADQTTRTLVLASLFDSSR